MSSARPEAAPTAESGEGLRNRKPKATKFRQQQLPAVHPVLTAGNVMPIFFLVGVIFIAIGIGLYVASDSTKELVFDYTDCKNEKNSSQFCYEVINRTETSTFCTCEVGTNGASGTILESGWSPNVMLYYGLTNFYQNHRSYVKSRDDNQLLGKISVAPTSDCEPYKTDTAGKYYIPCGAIANSMFSDEIEMHIKINNSDSDSGWQKMNLLRTGIAWEADKSYKFKNPKEDGKTLKQILQASNYTKPPNWPKELWELDSEDEDNNGLQNEDLMVWMRTAALPNFRKLYRRIDHVGDFKDGLPKGAEVKFRITYRYDVKSFTGTKSVILANTSVLGGKNPFLGIAYLVIGSICIVLGIVFFFINKRYGHNLSLPVSRPESL